MSFPREHWLKIRTTNPLERINREIRRRTDVVGVFPHRPGIVRLVGAVLCDLNDDWALVRRYVTVETREEEPAEQKSLGPKKSAARSINPDDASYTTLTEVTGPPPRPCDHGERAGAAL